jgi:hypothetical protein
MDYNEYNKQLTSYNKAMSERKSLQMTIRMNKVWITGDNKRSNDRRIVISGAQTRLKNLVIPVKPQKQYGFSVTTEDEEYFAPTTNIQIATIWADDDLDCPYSIQTSRRQITTNHQGLVW